MKKIIKLTEQDLGRIINQVLQEQSNIGSKENINPKNLKLGDGGRKNPKQVGDVKKLQQKLMDLKLLKTKSMIPTGYFGPLTKSALDAYESSVLPKKSTKDTSNKTQPVSSKDSALSGNIDTKFKDQFKIEKLNDKDSTFVCKAGQPDCGTFVNEFSKKLTAVGNAWLAHDIDKAGTRVMSSYTSLNPEQIDKVFNIFKKIVNQGGPKARKNGGQVESIKSLQQELIKDVSPSNLKVDDVVGIYYPPSDHHEEAFYEAGKPYFVSDGKGGWKKGNTISTGKGFGMNTHLGIVGGIKNGVPLIFHNIGGDVYSDPYNKLRGGGKIAWIKRS
jgi:hypothetical protein